MSFEKKAIFSANFIFSKKRAQAPALYYKYIMSILQGADHTLETSPTETLRTLETLHRADHTLDEALLTETKSPDDF